MEKIKENPMKKGKTLNFLFKNQITNYKIYKKWNILNKSDKIQNNYERKEAIKLVTINSPSMFL